MCFERHDRPHLIIMSSLEPQLVWQNLKDGAGAPSLNFQTNEQWVLSPNTRIKELFYPLDCLNKHFSLMVCLDEEFWREDLFFFSKLQKL